MAIQKKSLVSSGTKGTGKAVPASKLRNATTASKMTTAVAMTTAQNKIQLGKANSLTGMNLTKVNLLTAQRV